MGSEPMRPGTSSGGNPHDLEEIWEFIMNNNDGSVPGEFNVEEALNHVKKQRLNSSTDETFHLQADGGMNMYSNLLSATTSTTSSAGVVPQQTIPTQPQTDLFLEIRQPTILPALVDLEHQFTAIENSVTMLMRNLKQNIIESNGLLAPNVLDFVDARLKECKIQSEHLRNLLSAILDQSMLTGAELIAWDNCCLRAGDLTDVINLELNALQYCRVVDPSQLPPLAALTIVASPLPLATSEEQHLPGPIILCLRVSELAEVKVLADTVINIVYPTDAANSNETSVQHSTPRLYEKDGRLYIHFDRVRIMKPTRLQSVHFRFQTSIAQKVMVQRGEMMHLVESKPTLPIIVMANTGKQWRKAYYKLLEYYVFQEKAIEGCAHNMDYQGVASVYVSTTRFFNSLQILINSIARHCNYSSHKHANTKTLSEARPASIFNSFCPAELEYLKTSLFEDDLPSADSKKNKADRKSVV